ncbi:hypothetical protein ACI2OX_04695 [Bacillus sp. N9]
MFSVEVAQFCKKRDFTMKELGGLKGHKRNKSIQAVLFFFLLKG